MKNLIILLFVLLFSVISLAQDFQSNPGEINPFKSDKLSKSFSDNLYFGGEVGFSLGTYTAIGLSPIIGYKITPQVHFGLKAGFEHAWDGRYDPTVEYNNYGGSAILRYLPVRNVYLFTEGAYYSYEYASRDIYTGIVTKDRSGVPFLFLGAGVFTPIAKGISLYAEGKMDVINDQKSPLKQWVPIFSVGIVYGL